MATSTVEVVLQGIDRASTVFADAGASAERAMSDASTSVDNLSTTVEGVPDVDVSTANARDQIRQAEGTVESLGSEVDSTRGLFDRLKDGAAGAGDFIREHWDKIAVGSGVAGAALEGFARKQGETNYAFERMGRVTGAGSDEMRNMASELQNVTFPMEDVTALMETATQRGLEGDAIKNYANFWDMVGDATGEAGPELGKAGIALEMVGITAGNEAEALDAFGYITDNTTGSISEFLRFTERAGKELGDNTPHVNDMAAALAALEGEGYSARQAQRELQSALRETDGDMDAAMQTLGVSSDTYNTHKDAVEGSGVAIEANAQAYADSLTPMQKLAAWTENLMVQFGGLADLASMAAPVLIGLAGAVSAVRGAMQLAGMAGGPIMLVVAALAALVAGLVIAYKESEAFRNVVNRAWQLIQAAFAAAWSAIKPVLDAMRTWLAEVMPPILARVREIFQQVWQRVAGAVIDAWQKHIHPALVALGGWLRDTIPPILQTMRTVFERVWSAVQSAVQSAWSFVQPIFKTLQNVLSVVLPIAFNILRDIATVAFVGIRSIIQVAWSVISGIFNTIRQVVQHVLAPVFTWLWKNIIAPAFAAIGALIRAAWNGVIKPVFTFIRDFITNTLGPAFTWFWSNVIDPVWSWISRAIRTAWNSYIKPVFDTVTDVISNGLGPTFRWLYERVVKPVWDNVSRTIRNVWRNNIRPVFDALSDGVGTVRRAFERGVDMIGDAWDGLKNLTKKPVNFIIGTVWNSGIVKLWNNVATKFGASKLSTIPKLATGGRIRGPGTSTSDSVPALLSRGEHVISADEVSAMGGHKTVEELRAAARAGRVPAFARGGAVDWIREKAGAAWSGVKDTGRAVGGWVADKAKQATEFIKSPIKWLTNAAENLVGRMGTQTEFSKLAAKAPVQLIKDGAKKIKEMVGFGSHGNTDSDGGGPLRAGRWHRPSAGPITSRWGARPGLRGLTGSAFHNGIDIAGGHNIVAARDGRVIKAGWNILPTNSGIGALLGHGGGWQTYYGHMAPGSLSVRAGQEVTAGQRLGRQGATGNVTGVHLHFGVRKNGRFVNPTVTGLFDDGGQLEQGMSVVNNMTGGPEAVLTRPQWATMSQLADYAGLALAEPGTGNDRDDHDHDGPVIVEKNEYHFGDIVVPMDDLEDISTLKEFIDMLVEQQRLERAHGRGTKRSGKVDA